jgi:hypothetical protein
MYYTSHERKRVNSEEGEKYLCSAYHASLISAFYLKIMSVMKALSEKNERQ